MGRLEALLHVGEDVEIPNEARVLLVDVVHVAQEGRRVVEEFLSQAIQCARSSLRSGHMWQLHIVPWRLVVRCAARTSAARVKPSAYSLIHAVCVAGSLPALIWRLEIHMMGEPSRSALGTPSFLCADERVGTP